MALLNSGQKRGLGDRCLRDHVHALVPRSTSSIRRSPSASTQSGRSSQYSLRSFAAVRDYEFGNPVEKQENGSVLGTKLPYLSARDPEVVGSTEGQAKYRLHPVTGEVPDLDVLCLEGNRQEVRRYPVGRETAARLASPCARARKSASPANVKQYPLKRSGAGTAPHRVDLGAFGNKDHALEAYPLVAYSLTWTLAALRYFA